MTRAETIRFLTLRTLGNFLVLVALYGVFMTFGPAVWYQVSFEIIQLRGIHYIVRTQQQTGTQLPVEAIQQDLTTKASPGFASILSGSKNQILIPNDPLFSILIPKLAIDEQVVPNVDPDEPTAYLPVLQHAIAHAKGSVFPGEPGTTYLFAHSADNWWDIEHYNAVFYTLNNLSTGDDIVVFFENQRFNYTVTQKIIADPQDVRYLTSQHQGKQQLVLQTCWPPGTTFKRLYIIAKPKSSV